VVVEPRVLAGTRVAVVAERRLVRIVVFSRVRMQFTPA
jgi:hypothetical protein